MQGKQFLHDFAESAVFPFSVCYLINYPFHVAGLNGSSKSLTSTHPMLARGPSAERFSCLESKEFEDESLARKANIIILRGKENILW